MILQDNLITYIKVHLLVHTYQGTCSFKFSPRGNLTTVKCMKKLKWEVKKTLIYTIYVLVLCVQLLHEGKSVPLIITLESLLFAVANSIFCYTKWMVFKNRKRVVELFNLFLQFENQHLNGNTNNNNNNNNAFIV